MILAADASLDCAAEPRSLSVLTYNILHPNPSGGSDGGWWVYKYYSPSTPREAREWPHRSALIREQLLRAMADIVCLQETTEESFASTFGCLAEVGYDHVLHRKGDLRCATFWRASRFSLALEPQHKDRTLLTTLRSVQPHARVVHVINAHLKAGREPARRLRQAFDILEQTQKETKKLGQPVASTPIVFCGDFNSAPEGSGVQKLLRDGLIEPEFREAGYPEVGLTSKPRSQPFGRFDDAYELAYGAGGCPASLVLPDHYSYFFDVEQHALRPEIVQAISAMFSRFSGGRDEMDRAGVDAWITAINRQAGRGYEWKQACRCFERVGAETLTREAFLEIYACALHEGHIWSVFHDFYVCDVLPPVSTPRIFQGRFDQIQLTRQSLSLRAVRAALTEAQQRAVLELGETLPNTWHPSDHLPLGAILDWKF